MTTEALGRWIAAGTSLPARLLQQLQNEVPDLGHSDVEKMPSASAEDVSRIVPAPGADTGFSRTPDWLGNPVETGPLARQASHPLIAAFVARNGNTVGSRFLAQLVELATWLIPGGAATAVQQYTVADGRRARPRRNRARTAPASGTGERGPRGPLPHRRSHRVELPPGWRAHTGPRRAFGRDAADARRRAALLVQALDPCVACAIEVADA